MEYVVADMMIAQRGMVEKGATCFGQQVSGHL